jgi:hypothetical protein
MLAASHALSFLDDVAACCLPVSILTTRQSGDELRSASSHAKRHASAVYHEVNVEKDWESNQKIALRHKKF